MLSNETMELLEGFEKRMKFVNVIKYIKKHGFTDEIKEFFPDDQDMMDNLVISVLVFIMDSTLRYGEKCSKKDISRFLREMSEVYGYPADKSDVLTEFIINDILRNSGKLVDFNTYISSTNNFLKQNTIILLDNNGSYNLTDEVYEFLFRTKEIDTELEFSVSRFKLQEFIKRGNYSKALSQSNELVSMVRRLRGRMDDFMLRCKTNISKVSVDEYDELIKQVESAFEDESNQMNEIRAAVSAQLDAIINSANSGTIIANAENTEREINKILKNIDVVISEQTRIYNKKFSMGKCYADILESDFSDMLSKRFDFEKTIIEPMQKVDTDGIADLSKLLVPLFKPRFPRYFSIESFYGIQKKLREEAEPGYVDLTAGDEQVISIEEIRNKRYAAIIKAMFSYIKSDGELKFSGFVDSLNMEELSELCKDNSLLDVMMKLYSMGKIDIEGWKNSERNIIIPSGEFDLAYCLSELTDELLDIKSIRIDRLNEVCEFTIEGQMKIFSNDFEIEVVR